MYSDENLNCVDCGRTFQFTASEQEFYASKGFTNKPSRCADCRAARKAVGRRALGRQPRRRLRRCAARDVQSNLQSVRRRSGSSVSTARG